MGRKLQPVQVGTLKPGDRVLVRSSLNLPPERGTVQKVDRGKGGMPGHPMDYEDVLVDHDGPGGGWYQTYGPEGSKIFHDRIFASNYADESMNHHKQYGLFESQVDLLSEGYAKGDIVQDLKSREIGTVDAVEGNKLTVSWEGKFDSSVTGVVDEKSVKKIGKIKAGWNRFLRGADELADVVGEIGADMMSAMAK